MAQPSTLNEISQLILNKERELHQFHDLRCGQLEALVEERDQLLIESSRRFEKLKDDFEYNLSLIQARDVEIERLEHELRMCVQENDAAKTDRRNLTLQLEAARTRESDAMKKAELDRINNKRLFDELKDGIEQVRWSSEEESRNQAREIESLKHDIKRMNILREESLESQRRDLTSTFEGILQQREDAYNNKERDIAGQIRLLDTRFEQLQTENTRLKNELAASLRKSEHLVEDLSQKEEGRRQLQWSLDDERTARTQAENTMAHELQQAMLELSLCKDNAAKDVTELKRKLAALKEENTREKEFRVALEQRVEEVRRMAQQDLQTLETELEEGRALHARQHREIAALREERDLALQRACAAKVEADALDVRLNTLTVEYDGLAEELQSTRLRTQEAESAASRTQREFQDYRCQVGERETDTLQHVTAQLVEAKTSHLTEFAQLKKAHAEELSRMRAQCEETLAHRIREVEERHVMDMTAVQKQLQDRTSELAVVQDEYDQARQERATLQLRFSAQEAQSLKQQQEIKQLQQQLRAGGHGGGPHGREVDYTQPGRFYQGDEQPARDIHNGIGSIDYPPSPMFSEDLGAASFSYPNSPVNTSHAFGPRAVFRSEEFAPHDFQQRNRHVPEREAFGAWGESKTGGVYANAQNDERDSGEYSASAQDQRVDTLMDENERLKRIVKEMRNEVEQLHAQMELNNSTHSVPTPPPVAPAPPSHTSSSRHTPQHRQQASSSAEPALSGTQRSAASNHSFSSTRASMDGSDREKFGILEARLQQTVEEVQRLREERMSVMDVGNKLRSALNKQVNLEEPVDEAAASNLLAEVDHVRNWLTAAVPPARRGDAYSDYELSDGAYDYGYDSEPVAQRNSNRYHQEMERKRAGVSTATLLGTDPHDRSAYPQHRLPEPVTRDEARDQGRGAAPQEKYDSAGHRVWGSPVRRDGFRIPGPSDGRNTRVGTGPNEFDAAARTVTSNIRAKPSNTVEDTNLNKKLSDRTTEMRMQGHSVNAAASNVPSADTDVTNLPLVGSGLSNSAFSSGNNLLATAGSMLPRTNSSRMTPSQLDALKRIQDSKKRNSVYVGTTGAGANSAAVGGQRKVMNYAKWSES